MLIVTTLVVACSNLPLPESARPLGTTDGTQAPDASPGAAPSAIVRQPLILQCTESGRCTASTDAFFGTGKVEFGLDYDRQTGALIDRRTRFSLTLRRFAWSASFLHESGFPIIWTVSRVLDDGNELLMYTELDGTPDDPEVKPQLVDRQRMRALVDKLPGRYVMRFYGGMTIDRATLLAEGPFELI
jgi:hypothetical protein